MKNTEIWVFIFSLGLLGMNWPFLEIFYTSVAFYLFAAWIIFIMLVAFSAHKREGDKF